MVNMRTGLWALNLLLLAGAAYGLGYAGAGWLERELTERTPSSRPVQSRQQNDTSKRKRPLSDFQNILETNIFRTDRSVMQAAAELGATASGVARTAALKLSLTGTFVASTGSFAMVIGGSGSSKEKLYRTGECIPHLTEEPTRECEPGQGKLLRIRYDRIHVLVNGAEAVIKIEEHPIPQPAKPIASRTRTPNNAERKRQPAAAMGSGAPFPVQREGNTLSFQVPSAEVEKAFENFTDILKQARVVPFNQDGKPAGFQIRKIVAGSIFQRLGLQNFDVIEQVNGQSMTDADQALRMFSLFKNERQIRLDVRRRNESLRFEYDIQ